MYKIICNGNTIHNDELESLRVHDATVELELGKTGSLMFTIYADHPYYNTVEVMTSRVTVYRKDKIIFSGRVFKIEYGWHNEKRVSCEGDLAFLLDTLIPPTAYYGSFMGYFERCVTVHNSQVGESKQFVIGDFTAAEFFPYEVVSSDYVNTWDELNNRIITRSGGYLQARYTDGKRYLDLLSYDADISNVSNQPITFGTNLIDIKRDIDGSDIFTAVIPFGDEVDGVKVNIEGVNNYVPYVTNAEAVAKYGLIYKVVNFAGVTNPATLKIVAENYIRENYQAVSSIEISVADISVINTELDSFLPGQWVNVNSKYHFEANPSTFLVRKTRIGITDPAQTLISIGRVQRGLSEII
jgi:hypothetical protein